MKRKILILIIMISMFFSGFMNVNALTTSSDKTEDNVIPETQVEYGYHYTIRDYNGNIMKSSTAGFTHSNGSHVASGIFKHYDSNNNLLFCAELGKTFAKGATSTSQTTYKGNGPACGILKSMMKLDTTYEIGQIKPDDTEYSRLGLNDPLIITKDDFNNYKTNNTSYVKLQRALWKYETYKGDCKNGSTVITSYKEKVEDLSNPTLTLPKSAILKLSEDGKYYEAILNITLTNEKNLVGDITYTIDEPAIVEKINNKQIKVKVELASYKKGMSLNLKATGKYNDYKNNVYTPVVTVYHFGAVNNVINGVAQNIDNAQDMATISLEQKTETIQADLTATTKLSLTNDPVKIKLSKKDVAKEGEIEGAKISIYNYDEINKEKGDVLVEFTSSKEPYEYLLDPGVYALEETLAPSSYKKLETLFVFKVEADGSVKLLDTYSDKNIIVKDNTITLYNEIIVVPDTGSSSNIIYIVIGSILLLAGSGLIYFTIKRRIAQRI